MNLKELHITEFGCIKDRKFDFSSEKKLNIIYGENESGKSTVFLFIKFIFYGLPRKTQNNNEKDLSLSWSGGVASGSITFEHKGKEYRVERTIGEKARVERLTVFDLDAGMPITIDKTPGEYFFGVPREVFESSACTGQMRSTDINGEKTAQSLSNMLSTADESVDIAAILKSLNTVRTSYLHKNQTGGTLFEDENRIKSYRIKLDDAKNASLAIEGKEETFEKVKEQYEAVKAELETKDALVSQFNKIALLHRFETLRQEEEKIPSVSSKKVEFAEKNLATEFFPTRNHIAELSVSSKEFDRTAQRFSQKKTEREGLELGFDADAAELGIVAEENDGAQEMLEPYKKEQTKASRLRNFGIALVATAMTVALGAVAGFFAIGLLACVILACCSVAFLAGALVLLIKSSKMNKKAKGELEALAGSFGTTPEGFEERVEECLSQLALKREYISKNAKLGAELEVAKEDFERVRASATELLSLTVAEFEEVSSKIIDEEAARLTAFLDEYDKLALSEKTFLSKLQAERSSLARYDEEKIRSEITVDIASATPEAVEEAERTRSFLAAQKNAFESKIALLQNELFALKLKAEDPMPIGDKLASLEAKVAKDREFFDALVLAMETIEKASNSMRGNVTPVIGKTASELMGRISDQKYNVLRTNSTLGITLDRSGRGVDAELLSGGTKDLAYISLRLALIMKIYGEEYPPVIFDESFCQIDDVRLGKIITLLSSLASEDMQILIFTSHIREKTICENLNCQYNLIEM